MNKLYTETNINIEQDLKIGDLIEHYNQRFGEIKHQYEEATKFNYKNGILKLTDELISILYREVAVFKNKTYIVLDIFDTPIEIELNEVFQTVYDQLTCAKNSYYNSHVILTAQKELEVSKCNEA